MSPCSQHSCFYTPNFVFLHTKLRVFTHRNIQKAPFFLFNIRPLQLCQNCVTLLTLFNKTLALLITSRPSSLRPASSNLFWSQPTQKKVLSIALQRPIYPDTKQVHCRTTTSDRPSASEYQHHRRGPSGRVKRAPATAGGNFQLKARSGAGSFPERSEDRESK